MSIAKSEIVFKSGQELAVMIKTRQVSPVEVVQAYLDRIEGLRAIHGIWLIRQRDLRVDRASGWRRI